MDTRPGTIYECKRGTTKHAKMNYQLPNSDFVLEVIDGEQKGSMLQIRESTLKRWWRVATDYQEPNSVDLGGIKVPIEEIQKPFVTSENKKFVEVPSSVKAYEKNEVPTFEDLVDMLNIHQIEIKRLNKKYVILTDNSSLWAKSSYVSIYTNDDLKPYLENIGLVAISNIEKDKNRPYEFRVSTRRDFNNLLEVLKKCIKS